MNMKFPETSSECDEQIKQVKKETTIFVVFGLFSCILGWFLIDYFWILLLCIVVIVITMALLCHTANLLICAIKDLKTILERIENEK